MPNPFATCDLCDTHKNDSSGSFRVLPPVFRDFGGLRKFSGPVVTVKCFEDNSLLKAAVEGSAIMDPPLAPCLPSWWLIAVQIQGVWVRTGDWLYADEDGVLVMSSALN